MKILYATMQFGRGYAQGTERYVAMLTDGMQRRGHDVAVLAGDPERHGACLKLGESVQADPRILYYPTRGWMSVEGLPASDVVPLLEREKPDVLHVANPAHIGVGLLSAARTLHIPVVVTIMDFWWLCPKHTLFHSSGATCDAKVTWRDCLACLGASDARRWVRSVAGAPLLNSVALPILYYGKAIARGNGLEEIRRWQDRQSILLDALDAADAVIFPSRGAHQRLGPRLTRSRQCPIPYGLEPRWFDSKRPAPAAAKVSPERLTIGYAGALAPHKGPHLLLQAIKQLGWSKSRLRIAGHEADERYVQRLRDLAGGLNVEFVGRVESDAMPAFLRGLDLFVMPSIWPENLPIVVLETQAVGVPVLASHIDGVTETVPASMLFEPNSTEDLARRLQAWIADPVHPAPLQPVSTADEMVDRTLNLYTHIMARP